MEDIRFYCGLSHTYWHYHLCSPGPFACISPIVGRGRIEGYGINSVYVPAGTQVLQDSGAFGEPLSSGKHLTFAGALGRQERHAERYNYAERIAYRASYDLLVDHRFSDATTGMRRTILRCSPSDGEVSIEVTVQAARFLDQHRNGYALALNVQGVTPEQYLRCVKQVVPLLRDGDILGLGGWCILGRLPSMMGDFLEMLDLVIPFLARERVPRIHLYGCIYTPAIAAILAICDGAGIAVSFDSAFPAYGPCVGVWGYGSWHKRKYRRTPVFPSCYNGSCTPGTRCLGHECIRHVRLTRDWLGNFREREREIYRFYARNLDQYHLGQVLDFDIDAILKAGSVGLHSAHRPIPPVLMRGR
jgi:hypothetical protein